MGLEYVKTETNHIFLNVGIDAKVSYEKLLKNGVIIKLIMDNWVRVSIRTMEENRIFIEKLEKILKK